MNNYLGVEVNLDRVQRDYDPEHDISDGPLVTATDIRINDAVKALLVHVQALEMRIITLERFLEEGVI